MCLRQREENSLWMESDGWCRLAAIDRHNRNHLLTFSTIESVTTMGSPLVNSIFINQNRTILIQNKNSSISIFIIVWFMRLRAWSDFHRHLRYQTTQLLKNVLWCNVLLFGNLAIEGKEQVSNILKAKCSE